jgi:hypothetical protein
MKNLFLFILLLVGGGIGIILFFTSKYPVPMTTPQTVMMIAAILGYGFLLSVGNNYLKRRKAAK